MFRHLMKNRQLVEMIGVEPVTSYRCCFWCLRRDFRIRGIYHLVFFDGLHDPNIFDLH